MEKGLCVLFQILRLRPYATHSGRPAPDRHPPGDRHPPELHVSLRAHEVAAEGDSAAAPTSPRTLPSVLLSQCEPPLLQATWQGLSSWSPRRNKLGTGRTRGHMGPVPRGSGSRLVSEVSRPLHRGAATRLHHPLRYHGQNRPEPSPSGSNRCVNEVKSAGCAPRQTWVRKAATQ